MGISRIHRVGLILLLTLFAAESPATPTVVGYQLVSKKRSGRTTVDYTYRVLISNPGPALIEVSGTVASSSASTRVLSGPVNFGDVSAGGRVRSTGTMTIRQNRTVAYSPSVLSWSFVGFPGEGVPPDPGPAGAFSIEGIDADDDSVRDDLERYIAVTYPNSARIRASANQLARQYQLALASRSSQQLSRDAAVGLFLAIDCVSAIAPDSYTDAVLALESRSVNTPDRLRAYSEFDRHLAGGVFEMMPASASLSACDFDPGSLAD